MRVIANTTQVAIRLDGHDPMRGVVEPGGGDQAERFVGWLGLLAALEGLLAPDAEGEAEAPHKQGESSS